MGWFSKHQVANLFSWRDLLLFSGSQATWLKIEGTHLFWTSLGVFDILQELIELLLMFLVCIHGRHGFLLLGIFLVHLVDLLAHILCFIRWLTLSCWLISDLCTYLLLIKHIDYVLIGFVVDIWFFLLFHCFDDVAPFSWLQNRWDFIYWKGELLGTFSCFGLFTVLPNWGWLDAFILLTYLLTSGIFRFRFEILGIFLWLSK